MDDLLFPGIGEDTRDVMGNSQRTVFGKRPLLLDDFLQRGAGDELHRKVMEAVILTDIEGTNQIGVVERGGGPCFPIKGLNEFWLLR